MFEYLMPLLVMPTYDGTLLDETYRGVVERQIEYGRERGVPWGISESGYNKTDAQLNYQYRAFGVPGLGFKRGLADDLVIAPYASAMALMVAPEAACANLRRLAREGQLGALRLLRGHRLHAEPAAARQRPRRRALVHGAPPGHGVPVAGLPAARPADAARASTPIPRFRATDLLLQERVPQHARRSTRTRPRSSAAGEAAGDAESNLRVFTTPNTPAPEVHLLSNGRYHVAITNAGGGYSRWRDLAVTRWREDATRDCWGTFCYLRDVETRRVLVGRAPADARRAPTSYEAIFSQGRAEFRRRDGEHRHARRDQRLARGRHRAAPGQPHQPRPHAADASS